MSAFILIILPKCPYCFMAYGSAITICGLPVETMHTWEYVLIGIFTTVVVGSLLRSYRGNQTLLALAFAFIGIVLILYGFRNETLFYYHLGSVLMLISTVVNRKIFFPTFWSKTL